MTLNKLALLKVNKNCVLKQLLGVAYHEYIDVTKHLVGGQNRPIPIHCESKSF